MASSELRNARRVLITGIGTVAPNGVGKTAFWRNLLAGVSAVDLVTRFDTTKNSCRVAAEVKDFDPSEFVAGRRVKLMGRFSHLAIAAARLALRDAGIDRTRNSRLALCQGTAVQGMADLGEQSHFAFLDQGAAALSPTAGLESTAHAATAHVQAELGATGPVTTLASACCTGIDAISWALDIIQHSNIDIALAVAAEAPLSQFVFSLFDAGGYLSQWQGPPRKASRPYDSLRSGFVLAEGSAALVLEEADHATRRGVPAYAEVRASTSVGEAARHPGAHAYSQALAAAITTCLNSSDLTTQEIDYVCAHGNSIKTEDAAEAQAHRSAFGSYAYRIPISSIKSMIGQPFAAGGLLQAAVAALAIHTGQIPPTINLDFPDPECDLDYVPNVARIARVKNALVHSHSLGGHLPGSHSALALCAPPPPFS